MRCTLFGEWERLAQDTIRDSPFHVRWIRDGEMGMRLSELEVEKGREGRE